MISVRPHSINTDLKKNPAATHDCRGLDISALKRDGKPPPRCSRRRLRNLEPIVPDRARSAAAGGRHIQRCSDQQGPGSHLLGPPGLRSSTRTPRMRLAGLLLTVSVKLLMFDVDARRFSRMS